MEPNPALAIKNPSAKATPQSADGAPIRSPLRGRTFAGALVRTLQFITDVIVLNVVFHVLLLIRFGAFFAANPERMGGAPWSIYPELEIFMNLFWVAIALSMQLYRPAREIDRTGHVSGGLDQIRSVGKAGLLLAGSLLVFVVAQGGYEYYSRIFLASFLSAIPLALIGLRILEQSAASTVRHQTAPRKNVIVIGAGSSGERFYEIVSKNPNYGYRVLGFLDNAAAASGIPHRILGTLQDLDRVATRETVDEIVIALPDSDEATISNLVRECENRCIRVALIPSNEIAYGALNSQTIERVGDLSLVRVREAPLDQWSNRLIKRGFDILFSMLVLTLIFPIVFLVSAVLIKLSSLGPIFFKQARTGEDGQTFVCYKFRTMRDGRAAHLRQALPGDPRLTSVGHILRRTSIDELPQFWNVLKGEMSVVGPRPHMLKHTEDYRKIIAQYMVRHFVKPGLTGWAQVNGYRGATHRAEAMQRRIEHDLYYIENWSFLFDLTIVGRTIISIFRGDKNAY